nr:ribonuclease H-like domain-containing protein [Tanacetum cinerariifolium]
MALPEDHLAKFYKMDDAKEMWEAIKSRFCGNDESKRMLKYLLKQQFKGFSVSTLEGLHKWYDRFQTLLSPLDIHGVGVSHEDANQKFLRSLPSSWSQVALIMRTKPGLDTLSFDDLYNNLRVFERDVKGTTASSSNIQNVAFVFQTLLSPLDIHGVGVSHEDANQKFLRSLPSSWSQVALIMRTKPGLDTLSFDDLYNNLRVFERDVKGTTASSSNIQNVAFVSTKNTSSTNDVNTAYSVSSPSVSKSQKEGSSLYTDQVIHSFFANQLSAPQLDYDDLEQINDDDMEEMDLKKQVAMISMRIKKFHKRTRRKLQFDTKDPVGFDKTKGECFICHKIGHFARDCRAKRNQDSKRRDVGYNGNKTIDNGRRHAYQDDSKAFHEDKEVS